MAGAERAVGVVVGCTTLCSRGVLGCGGCWLGRWSGRRTDAARTYSRYLFSKVTGRATEATPVSHVRPVEWAEPILAEAVPGAVIRAVGIFRDLALLRDSRAPPFSVRPYGISGRDHEQAPAVGRSEIEIAAFSRDCLGRAHCDRALAELEPGRQSMSIQTRAEGSSVPLEGRPRDDRIDDPACRAAATDRVDGQDAGDRPSIGRRAEATSCRRAARLHPRPATGSPRTRASTRTG